MTGGVFISYRREDSGGFAGRIYDRVMSRLGRENVFFDVDTIRPAAISSTSFPSASANATRFWR